MAVTFFSDLRHFQQHIAAAQKRADGKGTKVKPVDDEVLAECAGHDVRAPLIERLDLVCTQQADLTVPPACVRIAVDTPIDREMSGMHVVLLDALALACAHSDYFTHDFTLRFDS